jgi:hypothetical protein
MPGRSRIQVLASIAVAMCASAATAATLFDVTEADGQYELTNDTELAWDWVVLNTSHLAQPDFILAVRLADVYSSREPVYTPSGFWSMTAIQSSIDSNRWTLEFVVPFVPMAIPPGAQLTFHVVTYRPDTNTLVVIESLPCQAQFTEGPYQPRRGAYFPGPSGPGPLACKAADLLADQVSLSFINMAIASTCTVQRCSSPLAADWSDVDTFTATGSATNWNGPWPAGWTQAYYRVVSQ